MRIHTHTYIFHVCVCVCVYIHTHIKEKHLLLISNRKVEVSFLIGCATISLASWFLTL